MSAFVDTSALYALLVRSEPRHDKVVRAFSTLASGGGTLVTTSYVLVETIALLQHRIGLESVADLCEAILPLLHVEEVSAEQRTRGLERLLRQGRRRLSLVDCVSFEVMHERGLRTALALDDHFAEAGFRVVPARTR
jgi:predicted nucleic acid-binding protein